MDNPKYPKYQINLHIITVWFRSLLFIVIPICLPVTTTLSVPSNLNNTYHAMGRFSRQQTDDTYIFLFFLENRIGHFMQMVSLGDHLHEVSDPIF